MKRRVLFFLAALLFLFASTACAEGELPKGIQDFFSAQSRSGHSISDSVEIENYFFVVTKDDQGTNHLYGFKQENGTWNEWLHTTSAIPQGTGSLTIGNAQGSSDLVTGEVYTAPTLSIARISKFGDSCDMDARYVLSNGTWLLSDFSSNEADNNYVVYCENNAVTYYSDIHATKPTGTVIATIQRDLRYVSLFSIPKSYKAAMAMYADSDFIMNPDGSYSLSSGSSLFTHGEEWISTESDERMITSFNVTNLSSGTIGMLHDQLPNVSAYQVDDESSLYTVVDGVLFSKDMKVLIAYPIAKEGSRYQVPMGVELIEDSAFAGNQHLSDLCIPSSVRVIGSSAFARMEALSHVQFCEGIEVIGDYAFESCIHLREISTPASLRIIGFAAFRYTNLSRVSMEDGILCIMREAFAHCNVTEPFSINLPATIVYWDADIFCPEMSICVYLEKGSYIDKANIIPSDCIVYQ